MSFLRMLIAKRHFHAHGYFAISYEHEAVALQFVYLLILTFLHTFRFSFRLPFVCVWKSLRRSKFSPLFRGAIHYAQHFTSSEICIGTVLVIQLFQGILSIMC